MSSPSASPSTSRQRVRLIVAGVVGLVVLVALTWWYAGNSAQRVTATTVAYRVDSDAAVWIKFDVDRPEGLPVTCTLRAMDGHFTVVGTADVVVPPQGGRVVGLEQTIRTTSRAVTGVVQDCVGDRG